MPVPPEPNVPDEPSITRGASGLMLSISFSTGMVGGGVGKVFAGVLPSGVCIAIPELEGRKGVGYFNSGSADPAPINFRKSRRSLIASLIACYGFPKMCATSFSFSQ